MQTCDDEALKRAMADDSTVTQLPSKLIPRLVNWQSCIQISFVFGLEVNWSLLQARQALRAEEDALHKEQMKRDIDELNQRRKKRKQNSESESISPLDVTDSGNVKPVKRKQQAKIRLEYYKVLAYKSFEFIVCTANRRRRAERKTIIAMNAKPPLQVTMIIVVILVIAKAMVCN